MDDTYLWLKSLHIIAVISWMCGMLYLPRLFVYHSQTKVGSEASEIFKLMEKRLLNIIMTPASIIALASGFFLALEINAFESEANGYWLFAKLGLVIVMGKTQMFLTKYQRAFARDERPKSEKYFRIFNEVPAVLMVIIVILVVVRPF